jgi:hypothetical protein
MLIGPRSSIAEREEFRQQIIAQPRSETGALRPNGHPAAQSSLKEGRNEQGWTG